MSLFHLFFGKRKKESTPPVPATNTWSWAQKPKPPLQKYKGKTEGSSKTPVQDRQVVNDFSNTVTRLKTQLLRSKLHTEKAKKLVTELFNLGAYDAIVQSLRFRKSNVNLYIYTSQLAFQRRDYKTALRLLKDILQPTTLQLVVREVASRDDFDQLDSIAETIECYTLYYHKKTRVDAAYQRHHIFAYAAIEAAKKRQYDRAHIYAQKAGRCTFVWKNLAEAIANNGDFFEIERFGTIAGKHRQLLWSQAERLCAEGSKWQSLFQTPPTEEAPIRV